MTELIEGPDPVFESVLAYHEGRMSDEERVRFEASLGNDPETRELLEDLRAFERTASDEEARPSEFEVAATLRSVRRRAADSTDSSARERSQWPAIAALLLVGVGLGLGIGIGLPEPEGPVATEIHQLYGLDEQVRGEESSPTRVIARAERQTLVVTLGEPVAPGSTLRWTLLRVASDAGPEIVFGPTEVAASEHGLVVLSLDRDRLRAGDYRLEISDPDGRAIDRFDFQWLPESP